MGVSHEPPMKITYLIGLSGLGRGIEQVANSVPRILHFLEDRYVSGEHIRRDYPIGWAEVREISGPVRDQKSRILNISLGHEFQSCDSSG